MGCGSRGDRRERDGLLSGGLRAETGTADRRLGAQDFDQTIARWRVLVGSLTVRSRLAWQCPTNLTKRPLSEGVSSLDVRSEAGIRPARLVTKWGASPRGWFRMTERHQPSDSTDT